MVYRKMPIALISKDEIDLEDGEIEDDDEETVKTPTPPVEKAAPPPPKKQSPPKLEPPIIEASAVDSAKLLVAKNKTKEPKTKESKKHSKKHAAKVAKQGGTKRLAEGQKPKQNAEVEDDWADNVEKAIRAAMGKDPGSVAIAREDVAHRSGPVVTTVLPPEFGTDPDGTGEISGEDKKSRKKKRKKRHRDEDGEDRKESKRRKKHHRKEEAEPGLEGEDDDEMLFVRGASPVTNSYHGDKRHTSGSPPPAYHDDPYLYPDDVSGQFDELYESYEDDSELEEYLHEIDGSRRGRGGVKRRGRGAMRGMLRKGVRPRDLLALKKRKRMLMQRHPDQRPDSVCMFFMQGKCQKGEDCPYSHDALPPRKMELCKFYLMDCCAKKDKCLYMHHDFPCKFHHTGLKCYAGDRCKFSHGQLNDILKNILLRHLETAPKEILGDFPRLSREGAAAMVHNKKTRDHSTTSSSAAAAAASTTSATTSGKPIPSLFDIEVPVPLQFMPDKEGGGDASPARKTTPMPSDNEDQDVNTEHSPTSKAESRSPNKRHKNRWDDSEETNDKPSRHDQNKQHWDEQIRKQQQEQTGRGEEGGGEREEGENEAEGRWSADAKQQRNEGGDSRWNERKRRNNNNEANERWNDNRQRDEGDNRWNENRQRDDGDNRWNENKQRDEGDNRWNNENRQRDDGGDSRWNNESRQREEDGDDRWNNESKQRDEGEKKKRRGDKEKKPQWEEGKEGHGRRRDNPRDDEKRKWESDERKSKKRAMKEKSGGYADSENYGDELDHMKPMTRCYKSEGKDEVTSQSQRLLRLAGYAGPQSGGGSSAGRPRPLDPDTDNDDDLVMDVDEHDRGRKESVDESALVIDTRDDEGGGARRRGEGEEGGATPTADDNAGETVDAVVIPIHIQKLPKKQQELFLRIQQQQREQQNSQGALAEDEPEEERQEESWYSSDEEETGETSLSDVLRKLSTSKVADPDLAKKVTDLTKVPDVSDAVNKLLSSIGMRTSQQPQTQTTAEPKLERQKSGSTLPALPLPPLPLPQPAAGPRDPRLSRDPRNRQGSGETRTSQDSPTPGSSSSSSSRVDPRARRRSSTSRSIYDSISLSGPEKPSDSPLGRGGDTDFRGLLPHPRDVDLRPTSRDLDLRVGYGDLDFRVGSDPRGAMSPLASSLLTAKTDPDVGVDIDLRRMLGGLPFKPVPQHTAATEIDGSLNSHPPIPYRVAVVSIPTPDYSRLKVSSTDQLVRVDPRLRKLFKINSSSPASPPPLATPSLVSPTPSGSGSGSNPPMIRADPRRLASQSRTSVPDSQDQAQQPDVGGYQQRGDATKPGEAFLAVQGTNLLNQQAQFVRNDPMSNPMLLQQMGPTMGHQNPHAMQNVDPRMFRNAPQTPGLLGDAPYYPPHYDEMDRDNGNGSDNDQRSYYQGGKRMGSTMEMQEWEQQQMMEDQQHHSYRRGNWRGHPRRMTNSRYQYDKRNVNRSNRSYTPPQM